jgi:hypothetical protein
MKVVEKYGRNFEPLMLFLFLRRSPRRGFRFIPSGVSFLKRKKICLRPSTVKNPQSLRRLLKQAEKLKI